MGQSGTEISRDAADLILLNDDFSVIVKAICQGRLMFHNVTLFIIYLLSCNSAEIWTILVAIVAGWPTPLTPLAILWANIIADIPPSMCLSLETVSAERLMRVRPEDVTERVLGPSTWALVLVNGVLLAAITLGCYHWSDFGTDLTARRSEAFLILIGLQILLALLSRSTCQSSLRKGILHNWWLVGSVILSFGFLMAGFYIPWLAQSLDLQPVTFATWARFGIGLSILWVGNEITKLILRRLDPDCTL